MAEKVAASGKAKRTSVPLGSISKEASKGEETKSFVGAYIVPAEWVNKLLMVVGELPRKLSPMIDPLLEELSKCYRGDINIVISPVNGQPEETKKNEE